MRIKQLEITGFKSFPDKCRIEFPPGISAVVGPNGCGKSNIIDAIKWVMGEQSIRQLRGKSMGDVIFAGSGKRPAVNMAEVSLLLSSDGAIPIDGMDAYTEVMITRRLYRSGASEYLLNRRPCRLKDILGLVLGSGMGSKSCAIVQQGNIGAITDATPEERRTFIEEAAGVSRYKIRKNEAVAKVNAAGQNLLRLNDIVDEIKKNMNSLSRQAARARRFQELRDQCRRTDALVSVYYYEKYCAQIKAAKDLAHDLKEKGDLFATQLKARLDLLEKLNIERSRKDADISEKRATLTDNQREIDRLESKLSHSTIEKERLFEEIRELESALAQLEEKNRQIISEISEESEKLDRQDARIAEISEIIKQEVEKCSALRAQRNDLNRKLEESKKQIFTFMTRKTRMEDIVAHARSNQATIRQRLKRLDEEETKSIRSRSELDQKRADAAGVLNRYIAEQSDLENKITCTRTTLDARIKSLAEQIKQATSLQNDRNKARSRYTTLKKMDDNHEWYKDGVKAIMNQKEAFSDDADEKSAMGIAGIAGIIGDVIEPAPGFELAVEAVLGEALHYIFIHDADAGIASINHLKERNAGRSGFIPLSLAPENPNAPPAPAIWSTHDLLLNHIAIHAGYENPVRALMEQIMVVDDFSSAINLWRAHGDVCKIVTRNGDIITRNGIMIGGSRDKLSGIYEKKRELKELGRTVSELDAAIETARQLQEQLESAVKQLENDISQYTIEKNNTDRKILDAEKHLYTIEETLKHTAYQHDVILLEKEKLMGEESDVEGSLLQHDQALAGLKRETAALETEIADLTSLMTEVDARLKDFERRQMDLRLELTRVSAERDSSGRTLGRLKSFQTDAIVQVRRIREDIDAKNVKITDAVHAIHEIETEFSDRQNKLKNMSREVKTGETALFEMVSRISEIEGEVAQARKTMEDIKDKSHQLELELSRYQLQQDNVINRFLERYAQSFDEMVHLYRDMIHAPDFSIETRETELTDFRKKIDQIGDVNLGAIESFEEQKQRHDFLVQQRDDLVEAIDDLQNVIKKINRISQHLFIEMFNKINEKFKGLFPKLFPGGEAWLELTEAASPNDTGVELMIHPPGKKLSRLSLLSGGEKALSAIAFIFSLFLINPSSYCLLDEIDAPLDDANIFRFNELLKIIGKDAQIIMISHNKRSMEFADVLFGVTMGESGVSRIVSVDIEKLMDPRNGENLN
ncbi:MAG: chromosome segregation protein SMC [Desulfobacteraceae bacterium]|jgi:chromosome segregation protein|nr:MAG: chromosome segregation protein SMC [Desulfobacteraceae bacterium]